jgi:2-phospho-L-lactate guanylyltransferase (CobY/MobA/RfbA family)
VAEVVVIVPLRSFARAKSRLRTVSGLDVDALVERLAQGVLGAARPRRTLVVTDDARVARWARDRLVEVVDAPVGLNASVEAAYRTLAAGGVAVIAHGDLAYPGGIGQFEPPPGLTVFTDHHESGTNVLVVPTGLDVVFGFGPRSRDHHEHEAARLGLPTRTVTDSPWRFDVDEPGDLERAGL